MNFIQDGLKDYPDMEHKLRQSLRDIEKLKVEMIEKFKKHVGNKHNIS